MTAAGRDEVYEKFGYQRWLGHSELFSPNVTVELGVAIMAELERVEPFQHTKSFYDDEYQRCAFMHKVFDQARVTHPVAMARAERAYFSGRAADAE